MTPMAVFDCMILLQAAANPAGQAGYCFLAVRTGRVRLALSQATRYEAHDVLSRPLVRSKVPALTDVRVSDLLVAVDALGVLYFNVATGGRYCRDPKDEKYLDVAIAANASYLVTRDNDLLDLMRDSGFRTGYPNLEILGPAEFLDRIACM